MNKAERASYIRSRAYELAGTGEHEDYMSIELAIRFEGYDEAHDVLDEHHIRNKLDDICARATKGKGIL
jgi:hypothetical protein